MSSPHGNANNLQTVDFAAPPPQPPFRYLSTLPACRPPPSIFLLGFSRRKSSHILIISRETYVKRLRNQPSRSPFTAWPILSVPYQLIMHLKGMSQPVRTCSEICERRAFDRPAVHRVFALSDPDHFIMRYLGRPLALASIQKEFSDLCLILFLRSMLTT